MTKFRLSLPQIDEKTRYAIIKAERDLYSAWVHAILSAYGWDFKKQPSPLDAINEICRRVRGEEKAAG